MQFFYVVRPNDTLQQIAKRRELPIQSLIAANNLPVSGQISMGQQLSIPQGVNIYQVQPADSVYRISQEYGVPTSMINEKNQLQAPYILQAGQLLNVPEGIPYYVVQSGDTLEQIAKRYNVTKDGEYSPDLIQQINELPSRTISQGMKLIIPSAQFNDDGFIAYTSNRGGTYDIWTYNLRNGENQQLTNGLGDTFSQPVWSPDSSRIAFVGKDRIIYIFYTVENIIAAIDQLEEGGDFTLDWSPDSSSLVYAARGIIILYNATLHEAEIVNQPGASDVNWFPNGSELLFQALDSSGISQLYSSGIVGTDRKQLTNNTAGPLQNVRLSSDGMFALYTTPGASISIINTLELSTGNVFEVKGGPLSKNYYPEWSPNSLQIAYSATDFERVGYFSQVRTVGHEGEDDRVRAISNCFSTPVTWSSDGRKLAYLSGCKEQESAKEIWVVNLNHPVPIRLIEGGNITALQWSPQPIMDVSKAEFTSEVFDVNFQYPASWKKITTERYEGSDGFFQISALFGSENIDEVCHAEAFQQSMPYGSAPQIIPKQTPYEQMCTILPSADQPAKMNGQAAFIVSYPTPTIIDGATYNYFVLWADQDHIKEISSTILFLP